MKRNWFTLNTVFSRYNLMPNVDNSIAGTRIEGQVTLLTLAATNV